MSRFEDIPQRIFLDSSTLQAMQTYAEFLYENVPLTSTDKIHSDPRGLDKLEGLRMVMLITQRLPLEMALSENSFAEVSKKRDARYLQWAYDVLDHWLTCCEESQGTEYDSTKINLIDGPQFGYLGAGDRALLRDAISLGCDTFLTMENKLPKNSAHIHKVLGIRVISPDGMWKILEPWAALFL